MAQIECFLRIGGLEFPVTIVGQGGFRRGDVFDLPPGIPERIEIYLTQADRIKIENALRGVESSIKNQKS
jgi:hypothetical protein